MSQTPTRIEPSPKSCHASPVCRSTQWRPDANARRSERRATLPRSMDAGSNASRPHSRFPLNRRGQLWIARCGRQHRVRWRKYWTDRPPALHTTHQRRACRSGGALYLEKLAFFGRNPLAIGICFRRGLGHDLGAPLLLLWLSRRCARSGKPRLK
jgi:hypothetical protein